MLECVEQMVEVAAVKDDPKSKSSPGAAWICGTAQSATPAKQSIGAPFPWVLGKPGCLETTGGAMHSGPARYARCK